MGSPRASTVFIVADDLSGAADAAAACADGGLIAMTVGPHVLPVITKAGTFGDDDALLRCRQALHDVHVADSEATLSTPKAAP